MGAGRSNRAKRLISNARRGRFRETLPDLLELARRLDAGEDAWGAAAAAVEILFWGEQFTAAADLTIELIKRQDMRGTKLWTHTFPFCAAILAEGLHAQGDPAARVAFALECAPEGSTVLKEQLAWLAEQIPERGLDELLPGYYAWTDTPSPLGEVIGGELVDRPYETLTPYDRTVVWQALRVANDAARGRQLLATYDEYPTQYPESVWLAGALALAGEREAAEMALLHAHDRWDPFQFWDAIPIDIVLQPVLRPVVTERVREQYLTQPIGPERSTTA